MSHLASGDEPHNPVNDLQAKRFAEMLAEARRKGLRFEVAHLSNSPSAMTRPDFAFDMVRPGVAVYGLSPIPERGDMGLRPAMTLRCPVAMVKSLTAGDAVSYGHTWIAERDTTVALLPIGYADGVYRALSGRVDVMINGRLRPSIGRICMDQFVVDLGPGPTDVVEGDQAVLFGPGGSGGADRPGLGGSAGHHPLRSGHQPARPGAAPLPGGRRRCPVDREGSPVGPRHPAIEAAKPEGAPSGNGKKAGLLAGLAGLSAVGAAAGCPRPGPCGSARPSTTPTRARTSPARGRPRLCDHHARRRPLVVREVGPVTAPLTVVFAHGFCMRMGAFHFQRAALAQRWGEQVRMVFYDQRGHGQSGSASIKTYTVEQLGRDLETVLQVMVPRGPVVLVGHSMGGMTVLPCPPVSGALRQAHRGRRAHLIGRRGVSRSPLGEILQNPALEAVRFAARYAPKLVHRTRGATRSLLRPIPRTASFGDEDQPQRRAVQRGDDPRHPDRHLVAFLHALGCTTRARRCRCWPGSRR